MAHNLARKNPNLVMAFAFVVSALACGLILNLSSRAAINPADINQDGIVNIFDLSILLSDWGTNNAAADINHSGTVDIFDLSMLLSSWGQTSSTPTPTPTVSPTPTPVYCSGRTPCYGPADMAKHAVAGNCWGYNIDWVIDLTAWTPFHPGGPAVIQTSSTCGKDIAGVLNGTVSSNGQTHNHTTSTKTNSSTSILASYRVGYFDASKP